MKQDIYYFYDEQLDDESYDEAMIEELFKNQRRSHKNKEREHKGNEPPSTQTVTDGYTYGESEETANEQIDVIEDEDDKEGEILKRMLERQSR